VIRFSALAKCTSLKADYAKIIVGTLSAFPKPSYIKRIEPASYPETEGQRQLLVKVHQASKLSRAATPSYLSEDRMVVAKLA
jgi:hypothetical protein